MTPLDFKDLREKCEAAIPAMSRRLSVRDFREDNEAFYKAASPSVVLELLDRVEAYEEALRGGSEKGGVFWREDALARFSAKEKEGGG